MSTLGFDVRLSCPFDEAVECVISELKQEGFGVVTDMDLRATLKARLGIERRPYRILGACNPPLVHRALEVDPNVGLLLPCNVVVREEQAHDVVVSFLDPQILSRLIPHPDLEAMAHQLNAKLQRVAAALVQTCAPSITPRGPRNKR